MSISAYNNCIMLLAVFVVQIIPLESLQWVFCQWCDNINALERHLTSVLIMR